MQDLLLIGNLYSEGVIDNLRSGATKVFNALEDGIESIGNIGKQPGADITQHKAKLYSIILKNNSTIDTGTKKTLQQKIYDCSSFKSLEEVAGQYNVWSYWRQYMNSLRET
jgi:hypothetical protein